MSNLPKLLLATITGLILGGCNLVLVQATPGPRANYFDGDFEFATNKGAIVTVIAGNPFGTSQQRLNAIVRQQMNKTIDAGNSNFVASPGETTVAPFKVVVAFNALPSVSNDDLCSQGTSTPTQNKPGVTTVNMAFCDGDRLKSGTIAYIHGLTSIDDSGFRELVSQATINMIPLQDGEEAGESNIN